MNPDQFPLAPLARLQFAALVVLVFQTFPRAAAMAISTAAPWAMLVAGAVAFLFLWPVTAMLARHPGTNLVDMALTAGGRPLAIALALLISLELVGGKGIVLRESSEMLVTAVFPYTPETFGMVALLVVAALGAATSPRALVWHGSLYAAVGGSVALLVLVGNLGWGQFGNVRPFTGPGILAVTGQILPLTSYFSELVSLAVLARYLTTPRGLVRSTGLVVGLAAIVWAAVLLVYLMVFPLPAGLDIPFPIFEMTRLVQGGRFLERLDAFWMIFWTVGSAGLTSLGLMTAALLFKEAFRLPSHRLAVLPLAVACLAVSLFPSNQQAAIAVETRFIRRWSFLITLALPALVAAIAWLRGGPKKRARGAATQLLLLLPLLLGGCWSRTEIEDTAYITAVAVDAAENDYIWTFRVVQAESLPMGMLTAPPTPTAGLATNVVNVRAVSLDSAIMMAQASFNRILSLEQLRFIVFGEDVARQGVAPVVAQLLRHYQVRRGAGAIVAMGKAYDLQIAFKPVGDLNPVKVDEGVLLTERRAHLGPPMRLQHLYSRLITIGVGAMLPIEAINPRIGEPPGAPLPSPSGRSMRAGEFPRHGGNPVEQAGSAIFRGDRMVGTLSVNETDFLLMLRGEHGKAYATIPDPDQPEKTLTIRFGQENKPRYRAAFLNGRPVVHVQLQMDGEIVANPGRTDYSRPENRRRLEMIVAGKRHREAFRQLIDKVYGEWGADPVGFGNLFRPHFRTLNDWLAYDWHGHVKELQVTVESELYIRRFGLTLGNQTRDLRKQ